MSVKNAAGKAITKPHSLRKRKDIINAAREIFLEQGYEGANMRLICEKADVSKRTIYHHLENKYELFIAIIQQLCESVMPPEKEDTQNARELTQEDYLKWLGVNFLSHIYEPEQIELFRTITAEARQFPEIGSAFYDGPISASERVIYDYLVEQIYRGKMKLKDPQLAASQFLGMLKSDAHMKLLFLKRKKIPLSEIEIIAENTVDLFLHGALRQPQT